MADTFLTAKQVQARYSISHMTLYRWEHDAEMGFPQPMIINRRKFYRIDALVAWEASQAIKSA